MMKISIKIFLFVFLFASVFSAYVLANDNSTMKSLIKQANEAYMQEKYNASIALYDSVLEADFVAPELYYNIGNAYYRLNKVPEAILYYEKALKIDPGNEDVRFNLSIAKSRIKDQIEPLPQMFYLRWWKAFSSSFTPDLWAILGLCVFFISLFLFWFYFFSFRIRIRKLSFYLGLISFLISLFLFSVSWLQLKKAETHQSAIIFAPSVTAKASPDENSTDLFVIHEGTKVFLQDNIGNWYEIILEDGTEGWIEADKFKKI